MTTVIPISFQRPHPNVDRRLLAGIQASAKFAAVAGGYLRDQFFGVEPKDLDVFVSPDFSLDHPALEGLRENFVPPPHVVSTEYLNHQERRGVFGVWDVHTFDPDERPYKPVQVIVMDAFCLEEVFDTFDYGFCQIGVCLTDTTRGICVTPAFLRDAGKNTATLLRPQPHHRPEHVEKRLRRLRGVYPTRTFLGLRGETLGDTEDTEDPLDL